MRSCAGRHRRNLRERTTGCASRAVTQTGWLPRLPRVVLAELHVDRAGAAQSPRSLRGRDRSALRAMPPFERSTTPASLSLGSVSRRHQRIAVRAGVFAFSGDRALLTYFVEKLLNGVCVFKVLVSRSGGGSAAT